MDVQLVGTADVETTAPSWTRPISRWTSPREVDPAQVLALSERLKLPPLVATLLVARGYGDPAKARDFLRPRIEHLHPPLAMRGMGDAVALCPPYIVTDEQIDEIFDRFGRGLDAN
jgi:single-stranded-DNA-specific exonuclease